MGWNSWNAENIQRLINEACVIANDKTMHIVLTASQSEVPLDEGFLTRSGMVIARRDRNQISSIISYGGGIGTGHPRIPYARRWHENQANFQHGRKWKYLRDPFNRIAPSLMMINLQRELRRVTG